MKKLRQRSGATILLALMLLLTATMVSIVLLTAATTTLRRVRAEEKTTQDMLTLQSTAKYLGEALNQLTFQKTITTESFEAVDGVPQAPQTSEVNMIYIGPETERKVLQNVGDLEKVFFDWFCTPDPQNPPEKTRDTTFYICRDGEVLQEVAVKGRFVPPGEDDRTYSTLVNFHLETGSGQAKQELYLQFHLDYRMETTNIENIRKVEKEYYLSTPWISAYEKEAPNVE